MDKEPRLALKIFLEFGLLMVVVAGFNLYSYFKGGKTMFLVMGIICLAAIVGWTCFYVFYVRRSNRPIEKPREGN